ncbi:hypothetical protein CC86DRAFT_287754 [Ophiobolus disseminans]|uniref:Yeast cell wall synthesis Kre9/Knh1-like N-terminal domain-containing protein n=1 Tax=Ophiobolus disseminans TaxID=1469910 RepID=A0A6A7A701_9PLEO|nr:hypothetical protein CC86DRAFT_287754 [Ophiobolus disseminans]
MLCRTLISMALDYSIDTYPSAGVEVGQTYPLTYSPKDEPATFMLRRGPLKTEVIILVILGSATGGTLPWTVDRTLTNAPDYPIVIVGPGGETNYSGPFGSKGGSGTELKEGSGTETSTNGGPFIRLPMRTTYLQSHRWHPCRIFHCHL